MQTCFPKRIVRTVAKAFVHENYQIQGNSKCPLHTLCRSQSKKDTPISLCMKQNRVTLNQDETP